MLTKLYVNINNNLAEPGGQAGQTKLHFGKKTETLQGEWFIASIGLIKSDNMVSFIT